MLLGSPWNTLSMAAVTFFCLVLYLRIYNRKANINHERNQFRETIIYICNLPNQQLKIFMTENISTCHWNCNDSIGCDCHNLVHVYGIRWRQIV